MSKGPVIPNVPSSLPQDQIQFFSALKGSIEHLLGHGRYKEEDRAAKVSELAILRGQISQDIDEITFTADETDLTAPQPPTNLVVTKGPFVHTLTWTNPTDQIAWFIEVWAAEDSQIRDNARLEGVYTITGDSRGQEGTYKHTGFDVTADMSYWIRSVSYGYQNSPWAPPDAQGPYIVLGTASVQQTIDDLLVVLSGELTEDQLEESLSGRIDLIDTAGSGLIDRISEIETSLDSYPNFTTSQAWSIDDVVRYSGKIYICIKATSTPAPYPNNTTYWKKIGETDTLAGIVANISTAVSTLDARVASNDGDISSHASSLSALSTSVGSNATVIAAEQLARSNADLSLAQDITTLRVDMGDDISAAVQTESTARAYADGALSDQINTVQTTVDGQTTAVQTMSESINGLQGKYTVKIDNNGYVTGFGMASTNNDGTPSSEFVMLVDSFKIVTPGESPKTPFVVGLVNGVSTMGMDGNALIDGSVKARSVEAYGIKADHIDASEVFVGLTIQSSDFILGSQGWKISDSVTQIGNLTMLAGSIAGQNVDDLIDNIDSANGSAAEAITELENIASDAKLTPVEKLALKPIWDAVVLEAQPTTGTLVVQAADLGVSSSSFAGEYEALKTYITTTKNVFADMAQSTTILRYAWDLRWKNYFHARTQLLNAVAAKAAELADWSQLRDDNSTFTLVNSKLVVKSSEGLTVEEGGDITLINAGNSDPAKIRWVDSVYNREFVFDTYNAAGLSFLRLSGNDKADQNLYLGGFNQTFLYADSIHLVSDGYHKNKFQTKFGAWVAQGSATGSTPVFEVQNDSGTGAYGDKILESYAGGDLRILGGIRFGSDTDAANTLSDYEEGTYPAALTPGSGAFDMHSSYNTLAYIKVGRQVTITGELKVESASSPSGNLSLNLPFTIANKADYSEAFCAPVMYGGINALGSPGCLMLYGWTGSTAYFVETTATGYSSSCADHFKVGSLVYVSLTYFTY